MDQLLKMKNHGNSRCRSIHIIQLAYICATVMDLDDRSAHGVRIGEVQGCHAMNTES